MIAIQTKKCSICEIEKELNEFYKHKNGKFGVISQCIECMKKIQKVYQQSKNGKETRKKYRQSQKSIVYIKNWNKENSYRIWAVKTLLQHKKRKFNIIISYNELELLAKNTKNCTYCNIQLDWSIGNKGKAKFNSPSLDRINNEKEIRLDNVQILCWQCNFTKRIRT